MRIGVCVKQVPAGSARMDGETGLLIRDSVGGTLNPYDLFALEAALQAAQGAAQQAAQTADEAIRAGSAATRRAGGRGEVFAITMGPPPAEQALREALALGADAAVLLSDPAFSGADVAATSRALAEGVRKYGVPDLIFCGRQTTDGDTAQLPFALAARLGLPVVGWVTGIEYFREDGYSVVQELSGGAARVRGAYPALFAVGREAVQPRPPSLTRRL
ncbi:MAG: hypothetical protein LBH70_03970, partial [Spirochaetaceae bacterium]|nr:hypothetical protein [Spirochaetaceae bacterium]